MANIKQNTGFRCRLDFISNDPPLLIDVAHNPAAIQRLVETINDAGYADNSWNIVFGAMEDKDFSTMLSLLKPICRKLCLTVPKISRAAGLETLNDTAVKLGYKTVIGHSSVHKAIRYAVLDRQPTLAVGSFYLIEEVLNELEIF